MRFQWFSLSIFKLHWIYCFGWLYFVVFLVHIRIHNKWMASTQKKQSWCIKAYKLKQFKFEKHKKMKGRKPFYRNPYTMHKIMFTMINIMKNAISFRINFGTLCMWTQSYQFCQLFFFCWKVSNEHVNCHTFFCLFQSKFSFSDTHCNSIGLNCVTREESSQSNWFLSLNLIFLFLLLLILFHFLTQKRNFFLVTQNGLYSV